MKKCESQRVNFAFLSKNNYRKIEKKKKKKKNKTKQNVEAFKALGFFFFLIFL